MQLPNFRSIRFRLPLLFMMASAIPALVSIYWISGLLNERMEQILDQRVRDSVTIVNNVFDEYTNDILLKGRVIAQTRSVHELLLAGQTIGLINELNTLNQDLHLTLYGAVIEIYDRNGRLVVSEPHRAKQQVPDRTIYTALKRNEFKVSRFFDGDKLRIATALPIFAPEQSGAIGVVALSFDVTHKLADEIHKITASEVLIFVNQLNQSPRLLATTLDETSSEQLILDYSQNKLNLAQRPDYMLAVREQGARNGRYFLAAAVETRSMLGVIQSLQKVLYGVAAAAALLSLIFALGLTRNLVERIVYLVHAARRVKEGELDQQIHVKSDDEFGTLADSLDAMRREIQLTLSQKESMIVNLTLRDELNSAMIRKAGSELLKEVLNIVMEAVKAQKGSIMMVDQASQKLILKVVYDPQEALEPQKVMEHISFTIGEGIAGQVAATGEAVICNDTHTDKRFKTYRFQEMDARIYNILCIPLKVDDRVLGVISLDNKPEGFADADLEIIQHLANQVAIAIQNAELYERSITDGLTSLFIRRYFEDVLEQEIKRSQRLKTSTALLMFDIDHFKRFNDTYGHQVGDWVIQKVAHVAKQSIRDGVDMAARYGGEEFAIVMPETDLEGAYQVGERLRKEIEDSFVYHEGHKLKITVSLGCAVFPAQASLKEELIQYADLALYASKHKGRNCTTAYRDELSMYEDSSSA